MNYYYPIVLCIIYTSGLFTKFNEIKELNKYNFFKYPAQGRIPNGRQNGYPFSTLKLHILLSMEVKAVGFDSFEPF